MKRRTKNTGLCRAAMPIAVALLFVFAVGSVSASTIAPKQSVQYEIQKQFVSAFLATPFFVAERPATEFVTIIWADATLPGYKPAVEARCNSPTNRTAKTI